MTNKEISIRSLVFLVIGILLILSLVICINIVNSEKDLVATDATVIKIKEDKDGTGKNDITAVYEVNKTTYQYNFYYKDDIKIDDVIEIYYHEKDVTSVQVGKTPKLIFLFPIAGILLCIFGIFELFSKHKEAESSLGENVKAKVIDEDEKTKTFKIINTEEESNYIKTAEEIEEVPVRGIKNKNEETKTKNDNKILPNKYRIKGDKVYYQEKGKEEEFLELKDISKIVKTINSNKELIKVTIKKDDTLLIFTSVINTNLEEFSSELHKIIKTINKDILEEIEYKEW